MENENGMLSQDEIDALLSITEDDEDKSETEDYIDESKTEGTESELTEKQSEQTSEEAIEVSEYLSDIQADALGEIGNISIGSSATTLSTLLNEKVSITTPTISVIKKPQLYDDFAFEHVNVQVEYVEGFVGQNIFVLKKEDSAIIADMMLGGDGTDPDDELTEIHLSAVQEVMNQMMGSAATSMSTIFDKLINISPPTIEYKDPTEGEKVAEEIDEEVFVKVAFQLEVGDLIDSSIMQLIPFPFAYDLVEELLTISSGEQAESSVEEVRDQTEQPTETQEEPVTVAQEEVAATVADKEVPLGSEQEQMSYQKRTEKEEPQVIGQSMVNNGANVQEASFSTFKDSGLTESEQRNLDMLLDVPLNVTVELGRTNRPIKDILELSTGSIVELDKLAGEPVDILVNDTLIAKGEVVVIDENFGVRVTDIISQSARIMSLQ